MKRRRLLVAVIGFAITIPVNIMLARWHKESTPKFFGYWITSSGDTGYQFDAGGTGYEEDLKTHETKALHWDWDSKGRFELHYTTDPTTYYLFTVEFRQLNDKTCLFLNKLDNPLYGAGMGNSPHETMTLTKLPPK